MATREILHKMLKLVMNKGSFASTALMLNFNVPSRAHYHQPPTPPVQVKVANFPVPPVMHIDAIELAHIVATVICEKDKKK